ncbi:hypothetical protein DFJ58DRAFT_813251 [Suillus subalutaceus]|uniref:uncharacterized protein n=1 Tax=Suillus subalutaceus TaxID=48586 RepID=UPI001B8837CB|nr:uncharacterized protein DFJ58DRAFT_813251 [Suillus subalutaceus]KAG1838899.1 hypothetical protein DFJ58DRAFT_813251 [Suillus subalutaceus]
MHRLPVELLQAVFLLLVNDIPNCPSIFSTGTTTMSANFASPPLLFTRVCRHWRDVAHSTPGIWSRIKVELPGALVQPLKPFFPSLLQYWLARSGNLPLTIRIEEILPSNLLYARAPNDGNSRLLKIIYDEMRRWETVFGCPAELGLSDNFNTPQLRTLEQLWDISDLTKFNAPNLRHLRVMYSLSVSIRSFRPNAACGSIRHLYLHQVLPSRIRYFPAIFPRLETLDVHVLTPHIQGMDMGSHSDTYSCLESMTLPFDRLSRDTFTIIFRGLHLPVLQKLTLVLGPGKPRVEKITEALAVAGSCNIKVVDFRLHESGNDLDVHTLEPLLSVVQEVAVCGEVMV